MLCLHAFLARPALCLAALSAATAAQAQFYGGYPPAGYPPAYGYYNAPPPPEPYYEGRPYAGPRVISPRAVVDRLEDLGFDDIGRPHFSGTLYTVDATGPGGARQRLVVDAVRGAILNRTALGGPAYRDRDDDDRDEDRSFRRRFGGAPSEALPYAGERGPAPRPRFGPDEDPAYRGGRREAARTPDSSARPGRALPAPADPRLAPSGPADRADRPFEGSCNGREAARTEPTPTKPYGTNPEGADRATKRKPTEQQARRPQNPAADEARKPAASPAAPVDSAPKADAPTGQSTADAKPRPNRPVRVIEGVTPMGASPSSGVAQLDNLPEPPSVPSPEAQ
ncbi:hypothetical protein [uncultured Enterovirga sp.]|uniref:hypothetical protein n=1 Tax=uncultured Enterovirga sp. TaxID=2026352 RepID=UPI0035CC2155